MKLYHYIHCPFCVRVRLALGFLKTPFESIVLPYDDEKTPIDLCKVKMLPIFQSQDFTSNESLDIITYLDQQKVLSTDKLQDSKEIEELLSKLGKPIHNLCMPYWIYTKEFNETSRSYFQTKKEMKRGPFNKLIQNKEIYLEDLNLLLKDLEVHLTPFYKNDRFSIFDIMLASHLWGMYIFPEFQFSQNIHNYLQNIKSICNFDYHEDLWCTN